uniref:Spermidine/spermine N1-acetyltransferase family member 2b n=1 Tax=Nothobranchius furzeri TaxID=105023 RepID=A0A8C6NRB2_NOTFU
MNFRVRAATKEDCKDVSRMIMELAVYEKMPDQVKISHEELQRDGFCQNPFFECLVAEIPEELKSKEGKLIVVFAQVGRSKQCVRLQLSVLNWNTPSRDFYAAKGGQDLTVSEGWHFVRFDGQNLDNLANDAPKI